MIIEGVQLHTDCKGTGFKDGNYDSGEACVECMGTGMIEGSIDIDG